LTPENQDKTTLFQRILEFLLYKNMKTFRKIEQHTNFCKFHYSIKINSVQTFREFLLNFHNLEILKFQCPSNFYCITPLMVYQL
jgi:hypothetical protein